MSFTRKLYKSKIKRRREARRFTGRIIAKNNVSNQYINKFNNKGIVLREPLTRNEIINNMAYYEAQEKYKPKPRSRSRSKPI
jgi:hypothetical protein